ncbi:MAG: NADH-quinone oxidoreductase subunit C [Lachnospiraceae bacterium]|nr:NADH-quinone oxidoreductase subunit C [Lachnospiraceae bacterium]
MAEVKNAENTIRNIEVNELLEAVMRQKTAGRRLSQACAAFVNEKYELSYSFADDDSYDYETLRVVIDVDTKVPSITDIMPQAVFYENEMKELFGVKIQMIALDYNNKLYRIEQEAPLGPKKEGKENG